MKLLVVDAGTAAYLAAYHQFFRSVSIHVPQSQFRLSAVICSIPPREFYQCIVPAQQHAAIQIFPRQCIEGGGAVLCFRQQSGLFFIPTENWTFSVGSTLFDTSGVWPNFSMPGAEITSKCSVAPSFSGFAASACRVTADPAAAPVVSGAGPHLRIVSTAGTSSKIITAPVPQRIL